MRRLTAAWAAALAALDLLGDGYGLGRLALRDKRWLLDVGRWCVVGGFADADTRFHRHALRWRVVAFRRREERRRRVGERLCICEHRLPRWR